MKKISVVLLGLLAIGLVSAGLVQYFGQLTTTIEVSPAIDVTGGETCVVSPAIGGETYECSEREISNKGTNEIDVEIITETVDEGVDDVFYTGRLGLAQKVVEFGSAPWELLPDGDTAVVKYTIVGGEFSAEVIEGAKEGYELIYYKDNSDRFNEPARARTIAEVTASGKNLPYDNDGNADEYDYCEIGEYLTCHGAKLWYVPSTALAGNEIDWAQAGDFLFETGLIQYNAEGIITMYPSPSILGFFPTFTTNVLANGTIVITTTVDLYED